ncbi:MAG: hypothetical protein LUE86_01730 [Clostridiales bacterium]|nr:hypothetical protein [Clostridiales bacterium]
MNHVAREDYTKDSTTKEKTKLFHVHTDRMTMDTDWHSGFHTSIQIDLQEDRDILTYCKEYQLTQEPLRIDTLIIRKLAGHIPRKNLAKFFLGHNIIEYKNPQDNFHINDLHKVLSYAAAYQANTARVREIDPDDISITVVCNHFPREVIRFLQEKRHAAVVNAFPGIYHVTGYAFPIQFAITRKLPSEEYPWISRLRKDLTVREDIDKLLNDCSGHEEDPLYRTALRTILNANEIQFEEVTSMTWKTVDMVLGEETGRRLYRECCDSVRDKVRDEMRDEVRSEVRDEVRQNAISNLMTTMKMTAEQAMAALMVPEADRSRYLAKL